MMRVTLRYVAPSPTPSDDTLCSALFRLTQNLVFNRECRVTAANTLVGPAVAALQYVQKDYSPLLLLSHFVE